MTVIICVPYPERAAATKRLIELAGGDSKAVDYATAGLVVADALALAYLSNGHAPTGHAAKPLPPAVAEMARGAEERLGLTEDTRAPATGSGARATRTRKTAAAAPSEE